MQPKKRNIKKFCTNYSGSLQPSEKVQAILQGAMQEFLTHGFAGTTMDRVTAAAGVSKTTVYSYFQDKEKLFIALIEHLIVSVGGAVLHQNLEALQGEPAEFLGGLANNFLNRLSNEVENTPEVLDLLRLVIAESGRFPALGQHLLRNTDKQFLAIVTQYLESHPELQLSDSGATARVFLGSLVHFTMVEYILQGGEIMPMERQRLIDCLVNLITGNLNLKEDKYAGSRQKSSRRKRGATGKFEQDYKEPKRLRSIRLTDTAWENLDALAQQNNLSRSELIELLARGVKFD
jgi:AcrR family transcriptional regulator